MKWVKRILLSIVSLVVILVVLVLALSQRRLSRSYSGHRAALTLPANSAALARGQHLATAIGMCGDCHGDNLGGTTFIDDKAFGRFPAPNLTRGRGGVGAVLTDADFEAAIRHGVGPGGKALAIMPAEGYTYMSNADLAALVAWVRRRPPMDNELPPRSVGPIGRILLALNVPLLPAERVDQQRKEADQVVAAVNADYGHYLAELGGCTGCHNPSLSGGPLPGARPTDRTPTNITPIGLVNWTLGDFRRALREGRRPQGTAIDTVMPWHYTRLMTDEEIEALWLYVRSVSAKPLGKQ
jgi:mono/diheme cytochrome c family protein